MFEGQRTKFAAKVRFFNKEEIRNTLGDLLAKYYRAANKNIKDEEDGNGDDDEDYTRVESYGDMRDATTAFVALFCEQPDFETEETAQSFLKEARSERDPKILDTLVDWANDVVETVLDGENALLVEESTTEQLLWALQPYTYQIGGLEGKGVVAPWPLVSAIDFGLDHPLLNEGIVFVDSPGLSDANSSRSRNAIMSHRECTHKIVVAEIGRAEADAAVRKSLQSGSRTRGSGHMLLVLTHGDSIDPGTEVFGTPNEKKGLARIEAELKDLRAKRTAKHREHMHTKVENRHDLAEELQSLVTEIRQLSTKRDSCRLKMRNRKVVVKMQEIYKGLTSDPKPLAAFAVGNQAYQQHVAGFSGEDMPLLSVKETSIPDLRHKLYTMPIQGRLNDTLHMAETQLQNLVNTIDLYCAQVHLARKDEIEAIVLAPKKLLRGLVHESYELLKAEVIQVILTPMKEQESEWVKKARKTCTVWTTKFNGQLGILKNEGQMKPRKNGANNGKAVDWNHELLRIGDDSLDDLFNKLTKKLSTSSWSKVLTNGLEKLCDDTQREIKRK